MPGTINVEIRGELWPQLRQNLLARQGVEEVVIVQILHHLVGDNHRVLRRPWLRRVAEDVKLNRQFVAPGIDIRVDPTRIGFKELAIARIRHFERLPRSCAQAQDSLLSVELQSLRAENFGKLSTGRAADYVHLP